MGTLRQWNKIVACALVVATLGCRSRGPGQSVTVDQVELRQTAAHVTAGATLAPSDRATISFPKEIVIDKVLVTQGQQVMKGDPILRIDLRNLQLRLDQLRAERREALAELEQTQYVLDNRDTMLQEGKLDEIQYGAIEQQVSAAQAQLEKVEADIAVVEQEMTRTSVGSPISGLVVEKNASHGQTVAAGESILEIVAANPMVASFQLTADEAGGIRVGDRVKVRIEELPGEDFEGEVSFVGPELHLPDRTFSVWALLDNQLGVLKIGMRAFVDFHSSKKHEVYVVPTPAIVMRQHRPFVFVIHEGIARLKRVTVKAIDRKEATLISGVAAGDWVVTKGQEGLQDGMIVDMRR